MIYRVDYYCPCEGSCGFDYVGSLKEAKRRKRNWDKEGDCGYTPCDDHDAEIFSKPTPKSKADMIRLLDHWASHNDNG